MVFGKIDEAFFYPFGRGVSFPNGTAPKRKQFINIFASNETMAKQTFLNPVQRYNKKTRPPNFGVSQIN